MVDKDDGGDIDGPETLLAPALGDSSRGRPRLSRFKRLRRFYF